MRSFSSPAGTLACALAGLMLAFTAAASAQAQRQPLLKADGAPLITFVELGSVNCIPCRMMQPVMKSVENRYGNQIKVIFYDVWKADQKKFAREYGVRVIPTQVFLDKDGKEIFRHEGFLPESEIDALLAKHGLNPAASS